jgi:uncharacterized RDD family membrane protein YckC
MEDVTRLSRCARCGASLPAGTDEGLCVACAAVVTEARTVLSAATSGVPGDPGDDLTVAAPHGGQPLAADAATVLSAGPIRPRSSRSPKLGPGQTFGPYRIERLLGRGGMGEVYEAEHVEHGRRLALKVLTGHFAGPEDRARFLREGELAASINHPNTVYVYGSEEIDGAPVITMELLTGGSLKDVIQARGALPPREAVVLILHVIAGLEAAQAVGILHRDIKPANCFIDANGVVKVGDFGLSIAAGGRAEGATGLFQGTPQFAPPEQLRGEPLDVRADIYAVGATLFFLLTAQPPFDDNDLTTLISRVKDEAPRSAREMRAGVPDALAAVVARCLAKDRAQRPPTYAALEDELRPLSSTAPTPAPLGRRVLAGMADHALFSVLVVPMTLFLVMRGTPEFGLSVSIGHTLVLTLYFALLESLWGASLGKRLAGLRVIRLDGQRPELLRALARAAVYQTSSLVSIVPTAIVGSAKMNEWATQHPGVGLLIAVSFYAAIAALFSTARRRNGFAAVHDRLTGTRVVRKLARLAHAAVDLGSPVGPQPFAGATRFGPYEIDGSIGMIGAGALLLGRDLRLNRRVWIHQQPAGAPAISPALKNVGRPARLRWLFGQRTATAAWDAYEAVEGAPLMSLARPQPWSVVRRWLQDLAVEIEAASSDDSLETLTLDRVWITPDGRARLLHFNAPGNPNGDGPSPVVTLDAAQPWLASVARRGLSGAAATARPGAAPLPPSAMHLLDRLSSGALGTPAETARAIADSIGRIEAVTPKRRAASIALAGLAPVFLAMVGLIAGIAMQRLAASSPDLDALALALRRLAATSEPAGQTPLDRDALETYVAGRFKSTLNDEVTWTHPLNAAKLGPHRPIATAALARHPNVSPAELDAAKARLGPFLEEQDKAVRDAQRRGAVAVRVAPVIMSLIGLGFAAAGGVVLAVAVRGGLMLKILGLAVVDPGGRRVSRARAGWRALIAWAPAALFVYIGISHPVFMNAATAARMPGWLAGAIVTGLVFLAGALLATLAPTRGPQDRIAGTFVVPE